MIAHASRPALSQTATTPLAGNLRLNDFGEAGVNHGQGGYVHPRAPHSPGTRPWAAFAPPWTCTIADEGVILDTTYVPTWRRTSWRARPTASQRASSGLARYSSDSGSRYPDARHRSTPTWLIRVRARTSRSPTPGTRSAIPRSPTS